MPKADGAKERKNVKDEGTIMAKGIQEKAASVETANDVSGGCELRQERAHGHDRPKMQLPAAAHRPAYEFAIVYGRISTTMPSSAQLKSAAAFSVLSKTQPYVTG